MVGGQVSVLRLINKNNLTALTSNKSTIIKITNEDGYPDGMTIESEGLLWLAHRDRWQITKWNPDIGEKLYCIKLPVAKLLPVHSAEKA